MKGDHDTASVSKAKWNDSNLPLTLSTVHPGKVNVGRVSPNTGSEGIQSERQRARSAYRKWSGHHKGL